MRVKAVLIGRDYGEARCGVCGHKLAEFGHAPHGGLIYVKCKHRHDGQTCNTVNVIYFSTCVTSKM